MGHSEHEDAVMYQYSLGTGKLSNDDIKGIQHIYGVPKSTSAEPTKEPLPPNKNDEEEDDRPIWDTRPLRNKTDETPDKCSTIYDAIAIIRKELFIFKDKYFWRPNSSDNETVQIHQFFSGLPSNLSRIDAVHENSEGKTLFFINQKLYIFEYRTLEEEVPLARVGLSGIQTVDKIFKWPYNNIVYLFSGEFYWRYDEKFNVILKNSKRAISKVFKDTFDTDTAFVMNKTLYFFKGLYYYAFDDRSMTMQRMKPMVSAAEFMGCNLPKVPPKVELESRFGEGGFDELIELEAQELPEDDDNPEKIDKKNEPDSAIALHFILSLAIACFITSYLSSSILLN
jgi:matrix metalloproteinase-16 (membrane-inserted)